jgi:Trypsin-co-occurring domain 1
VALPSPKEAFENALEVIQECVGGIGKRLEALARELRPDEISVEFSLQFEGTGTAQIIPVLVTTQTKATGGIKVNAVWRQLDKKT